MIHVPITLITGFLGSGKSTLINRLLQAFPHGVFGVVTNEYGEIGLESEIIGAPEDGIIELGNGCMCCVRRDDLLGGVARLLERRPAITQIVVEASGGSDPEPVVQTFLGHNPSARTRYHGCICVVDAVGFGRDHHDHAVVVRQVRQADSIVLTKLDLLPTEHHAKRYAELKQLVPHTPIHALAPHTDLRTIIDPDEPEPAELGDGDYARFSAARGTPGGAPPGDAPPGDAARGSHFELESFLFQAERPVDRAELEQTLAQLPDSVIRAKGLLRPAGPEHAHITYIVQYSAGRVQLYPCPRSRFDQDETTLLFVGTGLDRAALGAALRSCEV